MAVCRFDGAALLRMWSGKKVMFVGDSLALNQYESLLCLIHAAVPGATTTVSPRSGKIDPSTTVAFQVRIVYVCRPMASPFLSLPSGSRFQSGGRL